VEFTDFGPFDAAALTAATVRDGAGHDAVKSRAGVPLRGAFLNAATSTALAAPLRVIGRAGAGTDHVELAAAARHGVSVTHTPGSNASAVAEFALGQLLALTRGLTAHNEASHAGRWSTPATPARDLSGLTLGIVGLGRTGLALAERAGALGLTVRGFSRRSTGTTAGGRTAETAPRAQPRQQASTGHAADQGRDRERTAPTGHNGDSGRDRGRNGDRDRERAAATGHPAGPGPLPEQGSGPALVTGADSLSDLLAASDAVSLHVPLTPRTRGLIGRRELALMRPGSILLNTARGGIVDERALADALADPDQPLAAAAVDTFVHEHAVFASPLFGLPPARGRRLTGASSPRPPR
jgi:phosphoglycerate dehydrogenase-like enzyme